MSDLSLWPATFRNVVKTTALWCTRGSRTHPTNSRQAREAGSILGGQVRPWTQAPQARQTTIDYTMSRSTSPQYDEGKRMPRAINNQPSSWAAAIMTAKICEVHTPRSQLLCFFIRMAICRPSPSSQRVPFFFKRAHSSHMELPSVSYAIIFHVYLHIPQQY